jgi:hypothetical protein
MNIESIEHLYFNWLCAKVTTYNRYSTPSLTHWNLLRALHQTEFVWLLSGDDNRAEDGLELRRDFIFEAEAPDHPEWRRNPGCSVLEMLIAFSKRAEFQTGDKAKDWFWEFIDNLGLKEVNDGHEATLEDIEEVLDMFVWRTYDYDGDGGLFPLDYPTRDQQTLEIWYQFCDYLVDKGRLL